MQRDVKEKDLQQQRGMLICDVAYLSWPVQRNTSAYSCTIGQITVDLCCVDFLIKVGPEVYLLIILANFIYLKHPCSQNGRK